MSTVVSFTNDQKLEINFLNLSSSHRPEKPARRKITLHLEHYNFFHDDHRTEFVDFEFYGLSSTSRSTSCSTSCAADFLLTTFGRYRSNIRWYSIHLDLTLIDNEQVKVWTKRIEFINEGKSERKLNLVDIHRNYPDKSNWFFVNNFDARCESYLMKLDNLSNAVDVNDKDKNKDKNVRISLEKLDIDFKGLHGRELSIEYNKNYDQKINLHVCPYGFDPSRAKKGCECRYGNGASVSSKHIYISKQLFSKQSFSKVEDEKVEKYERVEKYRLNASSKYLEEGNSIYSVHYSDAKVIEVTELSVNDVSDVGDASELRERKVILLMDTLFPLSSASLTVVSNNFTFHTSSRDHIILEMKVYQGGFDQNLILSINFFLGTYETIDEIVHHYSDENNDEGHCESCGEEKNSLDISKQYVVCNDFDKGRFSGLVKCSVIATILVSDLIKIILGYI